MNDQQIFSQFYSTDTIRNEDAPRFRSRLLKYLEDVVNSGWPGEAFRLCRHMMGINIKRRPQKRFPARSYYCVEDTFGSEDVKNILDFVSVVYDFLLLHQEDRPVNSKGKIAELIRQVNCIFQEESMCYVLQDNGRVRYYPDNEFHEAVKTILVVLGKPQYQDNLKLFNDVLDDLYKNHGKESPIHEFFKCVEIFVLSLINDKKYKLLSESSVDVLMNKIVGRIESDSAYAVHDQEAVSYIRGIFSKWVSMCHKYRHGKADQVNNDVPPELFNFIFTVGISIFRFLLQTDDRYTIRS